MPIFKTNFVTIDPYLLAIICVIPCVNNFKNPLSPLFIALYWAMKTTKCPLSMMAMYSVNGFFKSDGENRVVNARHSLSLESVLTFRTLTPTTLGNWTTTHKRILFLVKSKHTLNTMYLPLFLKHASPKVLNTVYKLSLCENTSHGTWQIIWVKIHYLCTPSE